MPGRRFRSLWLRKSRDKHDEKRQLFFSLLLGLALAFLLLQWFDGALRPQLIALAETQVRNQLTHIADQAVSQALSEQALSYRDMVYLETGPDGTISTLSTDTVRLNHLKSEVLEQVVSQAESLNSHSLGIPLGALTGADLLAAFGPKLPVQVASVASAEGTLQNQFISAGINQTLHRLTLEVTLTAKLLLPGSVVEALFSIDVPIAETVIIGQVPQTYLNWNP